MLRTMRNAPETRMTASASSATVRIRRARETPEAALPRDSEARVAERRAAEARRAGTPPERNAAVSEARAAKPRTRASIAIWSARGSETGARRNSVDWSNPASRNPSAAAGGAEDETLCEELPDQASAARTEGAPNGELRTAAERAGERQVRDVGARDEQDETDGADENDERRAQPGGHLARKGSDVHGAFRVLLRMLEREPPADAVEVRPSLLERHARRHAAEGLQVLAAVAGLRKAEVVADGGPEPRRLVVAGRDQGLEIRGKDADDAVAVPVHPDDAAHDRRVRAEALAPEPVAQNDDAPGVRAVVLRTEILAERRTHAQHREVIRAHAHRGKELGDAVGHERGLPEPDGRHRVERAVAVAQLHVIREADVARRAASGRLVPVADHHQTVAAGIRKRPQEHGVEDREDRGARADPEGQRRERDGRIPRALPQRSCRVAQILEESVHRCILSR